MIPGHLQRTILRARIARIGRMSARDLDALQLAILARAVAQLART